MYRRSPSPSHRPAPTRIASRSPFPLGLCSSSTSLSKMGTKAAPRGRGSLDKMGRYPRHVLYFSRNFYLRQFDLFPKIKISIRDDSIPFKNLNFDPTTNSDSRSRSFGICPFCRIPFCRIPLCRKHGKICRFFFVKVGIFGAEYVPILLSEVEQEQRPSGNRDCEAIVVGAGLCDCEGERAYIGYAPHYIFALKKSVFADVDNDKCLAHFAEFRCPLCRIPMPTRFPQTVPYSFLRPIFAHPEGCRVIRNNQCLQLTS